MTERRRTDLINIRTILNDILAKMKAMEIAYAQELDQVDPVYSKSAKNLIRRAS